MARLARTLPAVRHAAPQNSERVWASRTICFSICFAYDPYVKQPVIREPDFAATPPTVDVVR
jgi:hypothetical protein